MMKVTPLSGESLKTSSRVTSPHSRARRPWTRRHGPLALFIGLAAIIGAGICPLMAWAQDELFVANSVSDSITVYSRTVSGDAAPLRTLQSLATGLKSMRDVAVDPLNDEVFVQSAPDSISVYPRTAT